MSLKLLSLSLSIGFLDCAPLHTHTYTHTCIQLCKQADRLQHLVPSVSVSQCYLQQPACRLMSPCVSWKYYKIANIWENSIDTYVMFVSYLVSFITPYMVFPNTLNPFIWAAKIIVMTTWRLPLLWVKVKLFFQTAHVNITHNPVCCSGVHAFRGRLPKQHCLPHSAGRVSVACRPNHREFTNNNIRIPLTLYSKWSA